MATGFHELKPADRGAIVASLYSQMAAKHKTKILDKSSAKEMQAAGRFLQFMGIMDSDKFMTRFATTYFRRMALPFKPGDYFARELDSQIRCCAHEFQHIVQYETLGMEYTWKYLSSSTHRARYEAEALRCNMELHWFLHGQLMEPRLLAQRLEVYKCSPADIVFVRQYLLSSTHIIRRGGVVSESSRQCIAILQGMGVETV